MTPNIKRFVTRPVEIEAIQWTGSNLDELRLFTGKRIVDGYELNIFEPMGTYLPEYLNKGFSGEVFDILHNTWIAVADGQWIVRGVKGEFYPCDNETFHWKYEEVYQPSERELKVREKMRGFPWEDK